MMFRKHGQVLVTTIAMLSASLYVGQPDSINAKSIAETLPAAFALTAEQRDEFEATGFVVVRAVFSKEEMLACRAYVDSVLWAEDLGKRPPLHGLVSAPGIFEDDWARDKGFYLPQAPQWVRNQTYRLHQPHTATRNGSPLNRLIYDRGVIETVKQLIGSQNFRKSGLVFERGTQQSLHEDTWYGLGGDVPGGMVAFYFVLDDIDAENGPLIYVPGSHKNRPEPNYSTSEVGRRERMRLPEGGAKRGFAHRSIRRYTSRSIHLTARAGDVAIWHERLLHGGAPIKNTQRTRLTMVMHYIN